MPLLNEGAWPLARFGNYAVLLEWYVISLRVAYRILLKLFRIGVVGYFLFFYTASLTRKFPDAESAFNQTSSFYANHQSGIWMKMVVLVNCAMFH
jgi:hypothetical protein